MPRPDKADADRQTSDASEWKTDLRQAGQAGNAGKIDDTSARLAHLREGGGAQRRQDRHRRKAEHGSRDERVDAGANHRAEALGGVAFVVASKKFSVAVDRVNVRVDGINRLTIPGSFKVHLLKDGKRIATKGFFQPVEANTCEICAKNAVVHSQSRPEVVNLRARYSARRKSRSSCFSCGGRSSNFSTTRLASEAG
jgi:hypothetical protein